jgi:hypothetical protein
MKFSEASGQLANLNYCDYSLKDLIDIARSVSNLKSSTLDAIALPLPYESRQDLVSINDLTVSIKYQRKMRLKKVLDKLKSHGTFNKEAAGHIDVAIRPNGKIYVWDGFRRTFMAGIVGLEYIPASIYRHPANRTEKQCEEYEAQMFKIRNADSETMKAEEIFRSEVVYNDPSALKFLDFLKECLLDVEGLNPGNKLLGGMVLVKSCWTNQHITETSLITSSRIIQKSWKTDPLVSGYLMCGLGKFLDVNSELDEPFDLDEILSAFQDFINVKPPRKQEELTTRRLNKAPNESIAYTIATNVLNMKGQQLKQFIDNVNLDEAEIDLIEQD